MNKGYFRNKLKSGVATSIVSAVVFFGIQGEARASSVCTSVTSTSPDTFNCEDTSAVPATTGSGTYTDGGAFSQGANGGFVISNSGSLSVVSNGVVNASTSSDQGLTSAVSLSATEALSFTNNGAISGSSSSGWVHTVYLRTDASVSANTGQVSAEGYRATGVVSQAFNGDNTTTGDATIASGVWSRGLWTDAFNGNNVTNTGDVTATGQWSRGVIANALQSANGCSTQGSQSTIVNVTGNVSADFVGIIAATCGTSTVNVQADQTVSTSGIDGQTIRTMATASAVTNIYGTVAAASTSNRALDARSGASSTFIGSTGVLSGTFSGDDGDDMIEVAAGGIWASAATSEFWSGNDALINNGTVQVDNAHFAGLESFTNKGLLAIAGGSFTLSGATLFENYGTVTVGLGETVITSDAVFVNNGIIDMQNGNVGDVLTITNGYLAGTNALILLDMANGQSDQFVIKGGSAGQTTIYVSGPQGISSSGTQIGTYEEGKGSLALQGYQSAISNFTMGNNASALIDYQLKQTGTAIYLLALPNSSAYQPLVLGELGEDLWHQSTEATLSQTRSRNGAQTKSFSLWGQLYAGNDRSGDRVTTSSFGTDTVIDERTKSNRSGVQLGADVPVFENARAGVTFGYEKADSDFRSSTGKLDLEAFNIGAYLAYGSDKGFYANVLVKLDSGEAEFDGSAFGDASKHPDIESLGGLLEAGYRWGVGFGKVGVHTSLAYVHTSIESFSAGGIDYDLSSVNGLRGSVGVEATFGSSRLAPYVSATLNADLAGKRTMTLSSGAEADQATAKYGRTWGRLEAGLKGAASVEPAVGLWVEVGEVSGFGGRAGIRF